MAARVRLAVAVAILLALAAHPVAHPTFKECPCTHAVATAALERAETFVLHVVATAVSTSVAPAEAPDVAVRASRGPPAA